MHGNTKITHENMGEACEAIRKHALANYEHGGWDYLVECYDRADLLREVEAAIAAGMTFADWRDDFARVLGYKDSYRRDIQAEAWY